MCTQRINKISMVLSIERGVNVCMCVCAMKNACIWRPPANLSFDFIICVWWYYWWTPLLLYCYRWRLNEGNELYVLYAQHGCSTLSFIRTSWRILTWRSHGRWVLCVLKIDQANKYTSLCKHTNYIETTISKINEIEMSSACTAISTL